MKNNLKLKDRNIDNTEPDVLKKLSNENFERRIKNFLVCKKSSIVVYTIFILLSIVFYINPIDLGFSNISIYTNVAAVLFSLFIIIFELLIRDELFSQKVSNSILDSYQEKN